MSNIYRIKTPPINMKMIQPYNKPFEIRLKDVGLLPGDIVIFEEFSKEKYTGNNEPREVAAIVDRPAPQGLIWVTVKPMEYSNRFKSKEGERSCA